MLLEDDKSESGESGDTSSEGSDSSSSSESVGSLADFIVNDDADASDSDDSYEGSDSGDSESSSDSSSEEEEGEVAENLPASASVAHTSSSSDHNDTADETNGAGVGSDVQAHESQKVKKGEDIDELLEEASEFIYGKKEAVVPVVKGQRLRKQATDLYVSKNEKHITGVIQKDRKKDILAEIAMWQGDGRSGGRIDADTGFEWPVLNKKSPFAFVMSEYDRVRRALGLDDDEEEDEQEENDTSDDDYEEGRVAKRSKITMDEEEDS